MSAPPPYDGPACSLIYVTLEPGAHNRIMPRPKTARQLLEALSIQEETALVIRRSDLLTPDRRIWPGEQIRVRLTGSRG